MTAAESVYESAVTASFRAWTEPEEQSRKGGKRKPPEPIRHVLIVDTETTTDIAQQLTFGTWMQGVVNEDGSVTRIAEGIFHADDLEETDPEGFVLLRRHCDENNADVSEHRWSGKRLRFESRTEFVEGTLWRVIGTLRGTVVMFNKPFDISRLAFKAGEGKGENYGYFVFHLWQESLYRPTVRVKHIDSKKAFMSLSAPKRQPKGHVKGDRNHGEFLDLRTLIFALTNSAPNLATACEMFHVEHGKSVAEEHGVITDDYIRYARRDALATTELFEALNREHETHPIALKATQAFSSASIAKGYLDAMGIQPRKDVDARSFTPTVLGACMESFYGGRTECRIRHTGVPVETHDFTSMYPTVNSLMGLWRYLIAERVTVKSDVKSVRKFVDSATLGVMFQRESWPELVGIAEVLPDGDVLPVRARYADGENDTIGLNPVTSDVPHWYTIADVVASKLITGKTPRILRAYRFVASGQLDGLTPVSLRSAIPVDPRSDDFFRKVVEERQTVKSRTRGHSESCGCDDCRTSAFLKVLANAGSYGIFSQFNKRDVEPGTTERVTVHNGRDSAFPSDVPGREVPGPMNFPPIATCITGAARLMLAMLERSVTDKGGVWAFCDTDSLAIVADETGSLVPCNGGPIVSDDGTAYVKALTYDETQGIRDRFDALSPYDKGKVPHLLKSEYRSLCFAVSAKRYACFTIDDGTVNLDFDAPLTHYTEHGLGHVMNPTGEKGKGWIKDYWQWQLSRVYDLPVANPAWLDRMAVGSHTVSSPALWKAFRIVNDGKTYTEGVKPFSFMMFALRKNKSRHGDKGGRLVTPFNTSPGSWEAVAWTDTKNPDAGLFSAAVEPSLERDLDERETLAVKSYGEVVYNMISHPEHKFNGSDGSPCEPFTSGLLSRRPTHIEQFRTIGKESNALAEATRQLVDDPTVEYAHKDSATDTATRTIIATLTDVDVSERATRRGRGTVSISRMTVRRYRGGEPVSPVARRAVVAVAADVARTALRERDDTDGRAPVNRSRMTDSLVLAEWARRIGDRERVCACGCGATVTGRRARYASGACRKRASRNTEPNTR